MWHTDGVGLVTPVIFVFVSPDPKSEYDESSRSIEIVINLLKSVDWNDLGIVLILINTYLI